MTDILEQAKKDLPLMKETGDPYYEMVCGLVDELERQISYAIQNSITSNMHYRNLKDARAECKKLRENQCTPEKCHGEVAKLSSELDRWKKIAAKAAATACKAIEITGIGWHKMISEEDIQEAARELGIDTNDHIPDATKMMLTAEQRAALDFALAYMGDDPNDNQDFNLMESIKVVRAMLAQSQPAWEITEGRRRAIELAQYGFRGFPQDAIDASIAELQEMLKEAGQ
jgi:hypothetical protein